MEPVPVLAIGMTVVILAILVLRLHAFLALLSGAFVVALLTPAENIEQTLRAGRTQTVHTVVGQQVTLVPSSISQTTSLPSVAAYVILRRDASSHSGEPPEEIWLGAQPAREDGDSDDRDSDHGMVTGEILSLAGTNPPALQPGDCLLERSVWSSSRTVARSAAIDRIATGFGDTCRALGILIASAAVLGRCLMDSGAAQLIVARLLAACGERRAPLAFVLASFALAIPVYFDTVFFLMLPLATAIAQRTGRDYLKYVLSIVAGGTLAHSLVPPTPGPLLVAAQLGVSFPQMFVAGVVIGSIGVAVSYPYVLWANRQWTISLPHVPPAATNPALRNSAPPDSVQPPPRTPPLWAAVLPIVIPLVLLAADTCLEALLQAQPNWGQLPPLQWAADWLGFWGHSNIALLTGTTAALAVLMWTRRTWRQAGLSTLPAALADGGTVLLITSMGGAFGHVIRQTNIAQVLAEAFPPTGSGVAILIGAFLVTASIRVAQGSATVAMITAVGIFAPLATMNQLPFHPVYLALAIGCGSKPLPWMNDSGFWVVGKMSGMTDVQTLKTFTALLTIMGIVAFAATLAGAVLLPFRPTG